MRSSEAEDEEIRFFLDRRQIRNELTGIIFLSCKHAFGFLYVDNSFS